MIYKITIPIRPNCLEMHDFSYARHDKLRFLNAQFSKWSKQSYSNTARGEDRNTNYYNIIVRVINGNKLMDCVTGNVDLEI
jgi:hypothetical protein